MKGNGLYAYDSSVKQVSVFIPYVGNSKCPENPEFND